MDMLEAENGQLEMTELLTKEEEQRQETERCAVVEAVLFTLGRAVEIGELAKACGCNSAQARRTVRQLAKCYEEQDGALLIRELDGRFQMCTNPKYYPNLIRLVSAPKKPVLTEVVMETLSIIACKHPATKVEIEKIRGVKSDHAVNKLIEYGLVEEVGRLDAPGRPALFAPTEEFYRRFGLSNRDDLPTVSPEAEETIREEVQEELSESLGEPVVIENAAAETEARMQQDGGKNQTEQKAKTQPDSRALLTEANGRKADRAKADTEKTDGGQPDSYRTVPGAEEEHGGID